MERAVFGRNRTKGFTLVEVLVASGVSVGVFTAVALFMVLFSSAMTDAGFVELEGSATGHVSSVPVSPNDTVHALARALRIELQNDFLNAGLVMAIPGIIQKGWPAADGLSLAIIRAPADAFKSPALFKSQLETPVDMEGLSLVDAEVPFTTKPGFTVLTLNTDMRVRSVTRVTWIDKTAGSDTYRLYEVTRTPLVGTPMTYSFAERSTALQSEPGLTFTQSDPGGEFLLSFPDPSIDLFSSYSRLTSQITDAGALAVAKNGISRDSRINLYAPMFP